MRTLQIRQFMVIGMLVILVIPRLFYEIPGLLDREVFERSHDKQQTADVESVMRDIGQTSTSLWQDADWQNSLREQTAKTHIGVILYDASSREIFHSVPKKSASSPDRQTLIMEGGKVLGSAEIFTPKQRSLVATFYALAAALLAILLISYQMGRVVVRPLEAMSAAARQIAGGNLDFQLPRSTVAEVEGVREAFQVMGKGLRESVKRQSSLEEERRFFISAIAHDLRTPVFVMRGFLTRLEQGLYNDPGKAKRYIEICSRKATQLDRLISDLFSYTKMEYSDIPIQPETVDVHLLMKSIISDFRPSAEAKDIELVLVSPGGDCLIQADAHLLGRALGNLVDNAILHTPPSGSIHASWQVEGQRVLFTVEDKGPGILAEDLPHIFDAFYRGDASRNPRTGGSGLGLAIASRVFRNHHGGLAAENGKTAGEIFKGWIPLKNSTKND